MMADEDHRRWVREKQGTTIRQMFNLISRRYDLANHVLSLGMDYRWRRFVRHQLSHLCPPARPSILDVCCGTGDLSFELSAMGSVIGVDFAGDMLRIGRRKAQGRSVDQSLHFCEADGLHLPFRDETFDVVTAAFGVRNFEDLAAGLHEMVRVLRPSGFVAILEFSRPHWPGFSTLFRIYFRYVLPYVGGFLTGHREPYRYLPASVESFIDPNTLKEMLRREGLSDLGVNRLTGGVASLTLGRKVPSARV